ncbi:hypothetical protein RS130_11825 [Paraglaciecola aquimarina]|uniref:PEP-CTERM protein-sorting domain-containing protein n=1 Tax=Paraglaciecola aquimarina TaxID=1235557 RepID=A0ABU3SWZ2_9ALTE|nr:hypothetical protein [Paraglaciecola aquimarina]MDU0354531.1 hypothetical protein [Paraglaciecola aquimarina]
MQNANRQSGCTTTSCTNPDDENGNPAGYFEFTFDFLVDIISLDTFDFEESNLLTAQFFDADDNEISTGYVFSAMVDGGFKRQDIEINGVQRLVLNLPGSGAIDNLVYRTTDVPAPTTLSIFAIALLFAVRRARR